MVSGKMFTIQLVDEVRLQLGVGCELDTLTGIVLRMSAQARLVARIKLGRPEN